MSSVLLDVIARRSSVSKTVTDLQRVPLPERLDWYTAVLPAIAALDREADTPSSAFQELLFAISQDLDGELATSVRVSPGRPGNSSGVSSGPSGT